MLLLQIPKTVQAPIRVYHTATIEKILAFPSQVPVIVSSPLQFGHILYLVSNYKISTGVPEQPSIKRKKKPSVIPSDSLRDSHIPCLFPRNVGLKKNSEAMVLFCKCL